MDLEVNFSLEDRELIAPVTALEFDKNAHLFVGEGPYLKIFETASGKLVTKERIFNGQRIHSVKVYESNGETRVIVCGGRNVSVLNVQDSGAANCFRIESISEVLFNDWIWDACLLQNTFSKDESCIAAVTGHNAVWVWNFKEDEKWKESQCEEQCILYCARLIGRTLERMWLACGTVFNEVLLWKVADGKNDSSKVLVRKRLAGHDGVIFSVKYDGKRHLLCSVSDDRSIKVWSTAFENDYSDLRVSSEPLLTLYGHKARVWDCLILKQHFVSVGEDSMCLLWNSEGKIVKSWKGHIGKSIWSLACDGNEQMIATGGGDNAIRLWLLDDKTEDTGEHLYLSLCIPNESKMNLQSGEETPRMIGLLYDNSVLVMTDKGNLYKFVWCQVNQLSTSRKWNLIQSEPEFSSYSIMSMSSCRTVVALGSINGTIKLISLTDPKWSSFQTKPYTDKVFSLQWLRAEQQNCFNLFSCGPEGLVIWWSVECCSGSRTFNCKVKAKFRLPYCRQRWPNSVFVHTPGVCLKMDALLVLCGDRRGSLHVFKATSEDEPVDPVQSLIGIHGRNGVTSICCNSGYIYTTGRDGYMRQYKLCGENLELLDKKKVYKGMEWIDRVYFTPDGNVLVLGFHTVDFIMWSMTRNEVLFRVPCGGGHRNWDIMYTTKDFCTSITFTYLKQTTVHVHSWAEMKKSLTSIQESFHGRETNCVCFIESLRKIKEGDQFRLLATGSEDTTINIMIYDAAKTNGRRLRKVFSCEGHISSVRCLAFIKVNSHQTQAFEHLLFSGGSRASLKSWRLDIDSVLDSEMTGESSTSSALLNSSCTLLAELRSLCRRKKKRGSKNLNEDFTSDIRFMSLSAFPLTDLLRSVWSDVDVSAVGIISGCSDGYIRFYVFDYHLKNFTLIGRGTSNERCLLCVGHFIYTTKLIVYATDTAGFISFWDVTELYVEHFLRVKKNKGVLSEEGCSSSNGHGGFKNGTVESANDFTMTACFDSRNCTTDDLTEKLSLEDDIRRPFYLHKLHQSGVNSISLVLKEHDRYLLVSGGDDGAVAFALFQIHAMNKKVEIFSWSMISVPDAHTSATTGVKLLDNKAAVSASVDQRMKVWNINYTDKESDKSTRLSSVTLLGSYSLDVIDVQDIDVQSDRDGSHHIAVSGVGLQILSVRCLGSSEAQVN